MDDATAGSIPTLFNNKGIDAPVKPAIIKLPVMAKKKHQAKHRVSIVK